MTFGGRPAEVLFRDLAKAVRAVRVAALLLGELGPVAHQETGKAGELVLFLRDDRDGQFLPGQVRSRKLHAFGGIGFVELPDNAAGIGRVRRTEGLQGSVA